jgi:DNA-binding response OmpR family regulator
MFPRFASSRRVLVVERDVIVATLIHDILEELGNEMSGYAYDRISAHEELGKRNYDAALLDTGLDEGHGHTRRLTEMKVPFALICDYTQSVEARHTKLPLLHKPFTVSELRGLLQELLPN